MPFTLSHPAAAAALRPLMQRGRLPLAAVGIGTMVPDFEFFLHMRPLALWSHSLLGLFAFCLPVGTVVFLTWEAFVREPTCHLLGLPALQEAHRQGTRLDCWIRAAAAVLLGAATHLFWDGFTHSGYWGAHFFPILRAPALFVFGSTVPWSNVLQHLSTAVGGVVVVAWFAGQLRRAGASRVILDSPWRRWSLITIVAIALGMGLGNTWWASGIAANYWGAKRLLQRFSVGALLGLGIALLGYSVWRRIVDRSDMHVPARGAT